MQPGNTQRQPASGRIMHVTTSDLSIKYLLRNQLYRLQRSGYEVHALSAPGEHRIELVREPFVYSCIPIARRIFPPFDMYTYHRMKQHFRGGGYDLVHMHTNKAGILGCWAAEAAGTPVVVSTVHGFYFHEDMHPALRQFYVQVYRQTFKRVKRVFMQSAEDMRTAVDEGIVPADRLVHIGNGIDLKRFDGSREHLHAEGLALRRVSGIPDDAFLIGIVARLNNEKGLAELIDAFARLRTSASREVRLVVIGDGPERRRFEGQARARGAGDTVHFVGFQERIEAWMKVMDVYALPSYREGFPRTLCEAFAIGVACVATDIRGCRELIQHDTTGLLVPPHDATSLTRALLRLVEDDELRGHIATAAQRHAAEHLDEQLIVDRIVEEYQALGVQPGDADAGARPRQPLRTRDANRPLPETTRKGIPV